MKKLKDIKNLLKKTFIVETPEPNVDFIWYHNTNDKYDDYEVELIYINDEFEELVVKLKGGRNEL